MKPKPEKTRPLYQIVPYRRSSVRETIVWLFFCLILVAGAFAWGVIYEHERRRNLEKDVLLQDQKIKAMNGRLIAVEGEKR